MRADPERLLDLLQRWEGHWKAVEAPVIAYLQNGLSDQEIDDRTAPLGLRLPVEARVLFRWHNGTSLLPHVSKRVGARFEFMPLEWMVKSTKECRAFALKVAEADPDQLVWERTWFALMAETICIDTAVADGETAQGLGKVVR